MKSIQSVTNDLLSAVLISLFLVVKTFAGFLLRFASFLASFSSQLRSKPNEHDIKVLNLKQLLENAPNYEVCGGCLL
jgi:hypothetical protein